MQLAIAIDYFSTIVTNAGSSYVLRPGTSRKDGKWMSGRLTGGPQEKIKKIGTVEGLVSLEKAAEVHREAMGNLRFPLDFTYHGRPWNFSELPTIEY